MIRHQEYMEARKMKVLLLVVFYFSTTAAQLSLLTVTLLSKQDCTDPPPKLENGIVLPLTALKSPVFYQCNAGYNLEGKKYNYCINGSWTFSSPPECIKREGGACVGVPARPTNGRISYFRRGNEARYKCSAGYRLLGSRRITCVNGTWTPSQPPSCIYSFCSRRPCARFAICRNVGTESYSCSCRKGYVGNGRVRCLRTCDPPLVYPNPENKTNIDYNPKKESYEENDEIEYTCEEGFIARHRHQASTRRVCADGVFQIFGPSRLPDCMPITCNAPEAPTNGDLQPRERESWNVGDSVTYSCNEGFVMLGPEKATCQDYGRFDNGQVRCLAVCEPPIPPNNGAVEPSDRAFFLEGDQVNYFCNDDAVLNGENIAFCNNFGEFDVPPPACSIIVESSAGGEEAQ